MVETLIATCGLTCTECPAYLATRAGDTARAREIAADWSREFHGDFRPEHVWCDGCVGGGRKSAICGECRIRSCAHARGVASCAHCEDCVCDELGRLFAMAPRAKAVLDRVRASL